MKKALSFALALAMCLSLTVPAFAEDGPISVEEGVKNISITADIGDLSLSDLNIEKSWTAISADYDEETWEELEVKSDMTSYRAVRPGTQFTVKHTGTVDDGTYLRVYITPYVNYGDGGYTWADWPHSCYLCRSGQFLADFIDPEDDGGVLELKAGESVTFTLPFSWYDEDGGDVIFELQAIMSFPQYDWAFWKYAYYKVDEAAYNAAVAKGPSTEPEQPTEPERPTTPVVTVEDIPASGTAVASTQTVTVDGKPVEFQMYALLDANGNGSNYIKLRDMAQVLNGTEAQFSVGYDGAISLTTGQAYTSTGTEMTTPFSGNRSYTGGAQTVKINGSNVDMTAITLLDDAGGGYNYFKLRDLGMALGFNVGWSSEQGVYIETDKPYQG